MNENTEADRKELTLLKGSITPPDGEKMPDIRITMTDNETGEVVAQSKPLERNGSFVFIIPPGKNYRIAFQDENSNVFYSEDIFVPKGSEYNEIEKAIKLNPVIIESTGGTTYKA